MDDGFVWNWRERKRRNMKKYRNHHYTVDVRAEKRVIGEKMVMHLYCLRSGVNTSFIIRDFLHKREKDSTQKTEYKQ